MIIIKSKEEIEIIRQSGKITALALQEVLKHVRHGVTTAELDRIAEESILKSGGKPAFKGYRGYPATLTVSINEEVVHGIPGKRKLGRGDIVSLDLGVILKGYYSDSAVTAAVGEVSVEKKKLMEVSREALYEGIKKARAGNRLSDISNVIQQYVEKNGFSVVRKLVGHGIGTQMHEEPHIPNFGEAGFGPVLQPGMVFAIEPMVNIGGHEVFEKEDNWTFVTEDGSCSAHFEHTVAITEGEPDILTLP